MPTYTTNYNLAKPDVNSAVDQDLWGNELNSDMDIIDSTMKSISDSVPTNAAIIDLVYPVGSYYINETVSTNPGTLLGHGTWTQVTDKFIVAHGSTYTSTGGAATVQLTPTNIPDITSKLEFGAGAPSNTGTSTYIGASNSGVTTSDGSKTATGAITSNNTSGSSSGTAFSIIPPYQAAYIWKRTA